MNTKFIVRQVLYTSFFQQQPIKFDLKISEPRFLGYEQKLAILYIILFCRMSRNKKFSPPRLNAPATAVHIAAFAIPRGNPKVEHTVVF